MINLVTIFPLILLTVMSQWADPLGLTMLLLICSIGCVVLRYSVRYLDGDARQISFIFYMALTLTGTTALVTVSRLDYFVVCWFAVSISLHKLLIFYPERPKAISCAKMKFILSRIGDIALILGTWLCFHTFNTLEFETLFSLINNSSDEYKNSLELIAVCFAIGALTKSAQLPFHHWLPQSLETPTPVSALMHAGIINAGGFLLIRLSFLFEHVVYANILLSVIGSITAVFGMSAMITQTAIKKRLAYSTIGQMGFMIMQCGLGLYSLALLHIIAHGFYKAYAFLRAGSAMEQARDQKFFPKRSRASSSAAAVGALFIALIILFGITITSSTNPYIPIICIWGLVFMHIFMQAITVKEGVLYSLIGASGIFVCMAAIYTCCAIIINSLLHNYLAESWLLLHTTSSHITILVVSSIFILGFILQTLVNRITATNIGLKLFLALHNGLYIGVRKIFKNFITPIYKEDLSETNKLSVNQILSLAQKSVEQVAPLWGLQNFVAVNPFWGFRDKSFSEAAQIIEKYCHSSITGADDQSQSHILTFSEFLDKRNNCALASLIEDEISKFCSLYFDRGQAIWEFPLKTKSLFDAWKDFASVDRMLSHQGINCTSFLGSMPDTYADILIKFQQKLNTQDSLLIEALFSRAIFSIKGWASYSQHFVFEDAKAGNANSLCIELLAIRLTYDLMLLSVNEFQGEIIHYVNSMSEALLISNSEHKTAYTFIETGEENFIRSLRAHFERPSQVKELIRPEVQAVFCIDVRSEGYRRFLELQSEGIETYGFAGFFGLTLRHKELASESTVNQCPVLLQNTFTVSEVVAQKSSNINLFLFNFRRHLTGLIKILRQSISSGFTFVESWGILYLVKMIKETLKISLNSQQVNTFTEISIDLTFSEKVQNARAILKNMGLNNNMAPLVLLCGHESTTINNPFNASLDCGACGGHSGRVNVITASYILNNSEVRLELAKTGTIIPSDTIFIPGIHNTTTDEVTLLSDHVLQTNEPRINQLKLWLSNASKFSRKSRLANLGFSENSNDQICIAKSADWSEVRPEWGLARNAGFIAARRARTRAAKLENRCFLHEYNFEKDHDLSILELIMTAPMVVASWINLQYFASTIAPNYFGSGNKVIHNVVGQLGVILGNGGDLQIGLPLQSVHTGKEPFHEPLRLQVVIEAPMDAIEKIISKHQLLQMLIKNDWIKVFSLDNIGTLTNVKG